MNIFSDIYNYFQFLSFVDIVFLMAIIILIILIVALIYFIKINNEILNEDDFFPKSKVENNDNIINKIEEVVETPKEDSVLEEPELIDLKTLTKKLEEEQNTERINFTEYEKDQEEKAIISYDELLKKKNKYAVNYEKEEMIDDLLIKKVDLNDLVNKNEIDDIKEDVIVISYQKEEAFLKALKELNSLLN